MNPFKCDKDSGMVLARSRAHTFPECGKAVLFGNHAAVCYAPTLVVNYEGSTSRV